jgi:hypothetical protein
MIPVSALLRRGIEKSWPELSVIMRGRAPRFVYGAGAVRALPVFAYHRVDASFERDLELLAAGGYRTVGAEAVEASGVARCAPDSRVVALTFDDGDASLVDTAVPLLARYGFRATAFVVAGRVPERTSATRAGWRELRAAVAAGVLDVGPHSLYHHHVPVSPRVIGFVDSSTDTDFTANVPVPRVRGDEPMLPGAPIFRGAPRYALRPAFLPDRAVLERCVRFAEQEGPGLFHTPGWQRRLREVAGEIGGRRESSDEAEAEVARDIRDSLRIVAQRCPNPAERHLCYPWYAGGRRLDAIAGEAGVRVVYKGVEPSRGLPPGRLPVGIRRLPPEWLGRLPGPARRPLRTLAVRRLQALARGPA